MIDRAKQLLESGEVARVLGWRRGETEFDVEPAYFETAESLDGLFYNAFCGANLSKYLIEAGKKDGKTLVFLKPCDSYSYNQLLREHRVEREKAYIIGIGCNACRNVCPACSCRKCVFDSTAFDSAQKANTTSFEEKVFHVIRAFHVAGRCTDCGECSRVCPQGIPLHLFNRKFIKDINTIYGDYQAGAVLESKAPLTSFRTDDAEPGVGRG